MILATMAPMPTMAQQVTAVTTMAWAEGPTVDRAGNVYFSDVRSDRIMRYAPDGALSVDRQPANNPNGIADDGIRQLLAFDLAPDGTASNKRVLKDFRPGRSGDSIAIDTEGNIYVAAGLNTLRGTKEPLASKAGIYVFTPKGDLRTFVPIPEDPVTNLTFAGTDMRTVFVTAGKTLFRFENDIPGLPR